MIRHIQYAKYLLRHKWFVFLACCKLGIPLAGIVHDWSKFLPDEWIPYADYFNGPKFPHLADLHGDERNRAFDSFRYADRIEDAFRLAWVKHQHRNPHHWQHWISHEDEGVTRFLIIPERYLREMVADWMGAGRAQNRTDGSIEGAAAWYMSYRSGILMHAASRIQLESLLGVHIEEEAKV